AHLLRHFQHVRAHQDGDTAAAHLSKDVLDQARTARIEADHRLVDEDRLRTMEECCTHDQPLLHSVRKTLHQFVFPSSELEQLEHLAHAFATRRTIESVKASVKPQEFTRGQLLVEEWTIGNESKRRLRALRVRLQ